MILELAESPKRKSKYITVDAYKRKTTVKAHQRRRPVLNSGDNHIYIPAHLSEYLLPPNLGSGGQGMYVREDFFDGLSDGDWHTLMDELLEHDPMLSELSFGGKWKAKRKAKKDAKAARKKEKWERRQKRKDLRTASWAQKRLMKGQRAAQDAEASGSEGGANTGNSILDNIINKGTEIIDKVKGGGGGRSGGDADEPDGQEGDNSGGTPSKDDDTIFGMPKMVVYGGGTLLAIAILYKLSKGKK